MQTFDETCAEVGSLRSLLSAIPEDYVIDRASIKARICVVIEKAILNASREVTRIVRTPPEGFSADSEPTGLWWTLNAERALEELVRLVEFGEKENAL